MVHRTKIIFIGIVVVIGTITSLAVIFILSSAYLDQQYANSHQGCFPSRSNHRVVIQDDKVSPANTVGSKCDTLTIINLDDIQRMVAFGPHEDHVAYDGIKERMLTKGQSLTVTLVQVGDFRFHDHIHDEVQGMFTVN